MEYFSDKERDPKPRIVQTIPPSVWGGIAAYIKTQISNGAFGYQFPEICQDGNGTTGTDEGAYSLTLKAENPDIRWPFETERVKEGGLSWDLEPYAPDTLAILDVIQFCYKHAAKPIQLNFHPFFGHYHLGYDANIGQQEFRDRINVIFSRNGLAYELEATGSIIRLAPPIIGEALNNTVFCTGDSFLDQMLDEARRKFLDPNPIIRTEAVERLWDCWERIKSLKDPNNKKVSINLLLDKVSSLPEIKSIIEGEMKELTVIGNTFHIRHSEISQIKILDTDIYDYLFHRLFCMIQLLLRNI